jgi:hypothetical protein
MAKRMTKVTEIITIGTTLNAYSSLLIPANEVIEQGFKSAWGQTLQVAIDDMAELIHAIWLGTVP